MITLDHPDAKKIAAGIGVKKVTLIDTARGPKTGFTVASNRKDVWWEFRIGRPNARGRLTLDGWKYTAADGETAPKAQLNWIVPIDGKVTASRIADTAAAIRRYQSRFEAGYEPNWDLIYAGKEVAKEWKRSH